MSYKSKTFKSFPFLIFFIAITIVINGIFFVNKVTLINNEREFVENAILDKQWEIVKEEIINRYHLSVEKINYIAKELECQILREYGQDLDKLKEEFENKEFTQKLYDILKDVLQDQDETIIVGFRDKLLSVFSKVDKNTSNISTWEQYFNSSANIQLNQTLISNIINKNVTENMLLYQLSNLDIGSFTIPSHSVDALEQLFLDKGIDGLKAIEYVCVAYITEYADIFGTDDHYYLENNDNFKLMIVSTTNIYDVIKDSVEVKFEHLEIEQQLTLSELKSNIIKECFHFIVITIALLTLIFVFGLFYNQDLEDGPKYKY